MLNQTFPYGPKIIVIKIYVNTMPADALVPVVTTASLVLILDIRGMCPSAKGINHNPFQYKYGILVTGIYIIKIRRS